MQDSAQMAETLHRANLLCVLAHGLLLDQAADEPLVQASALLCPYTCKDSGWLLTCKDGAYHEAKQEGRTLWIVHFGSCI